MNSKTVKTVIAGFAALSMVGCSQQTASSGTVSTALTMTGSSQASTIAKYKIEHPWLNLFMPAAMALPAPAMTDASGANVTLSKAWVVVKEVELEMTEQVSSAEDDGAEDSIEFSGPFVVDLLSAAPTSFGVAEVPAGVYRRIKMKLEKDAVLPAEAPMGLAGNSIYFEATVAGNQLTYSADDGTEFKISGAGGINLGESSNVLMAIKLADLFKMIDLSGVTSNVNITSSNRVAGVNLCPLIDSSAQDLYTCFRKGLEAAGKLGKDDDGDCEIEEHEDEVED
ncbi:hypothetical protein Bb109J_c3442 [Bdellovibrio bacteriovorus]|uniref:DUF4382 domain-containing protein n=1 Tax=Bdellovibrio bacteriovorus TaxID=959 RepID=UPI0009B879DA|nr:DUF4382 domain-containing protein [Bdellovibrio bacteriovorus]BEV70022.1 hypothetical protein Bb109J_c3442 [Bdellovibrio bacteriovorus]